MVDPRHTRCKKWMQAVGKKLMADQAYLEKVREVNKLQDKLEILQQAIIESQANMEKAGHSSVGSRAYHAYTKYKEYNMMTHPTDDDLNAIGLRDGGYPA